MTVASPSPELLAAFEANPLGPHDPELSALVRQLRGHDTTGPWVVVLQGKGPACWLGRIPTRRWAPIEIEPDCLYADAAAAETALFKRRWSRAFESTSP